MKFLPQSPILLCVMVLLLTVAHAHQMFGRFVPHHHDVEMPANHQDGERGRNADDGQTYPEHMLEHSALVAVLPSRIMLTAMILHPIALMDMRAAEMPDAPVTGIDHPPQLIG